jgi:hypothetical protein
LLCRFETPRANRRSFKAPDPEGRHHAAGVLAEDRGGAGDVSTDAQSHSIMKIGYVISEGLTLAIVLFVALVVSWLRGTRAKNSRDHGFASAGCF